MTTIIVLLAAIGGICAVLTIGGIVSDEIMPHVKAIQNFLNTLPMSNKH